MADIVFPSYLNDDAYKNRKFTINVMQMPTLGDGVEAALTKIKEKAKLSLGSTSSDDVKTIVKNLEKNYAKFYGNSETIYTIVLPLPNTFSDTQNHSWNTETSVLGTMGNALQNKSLGDIANPFGSKMGAVGKIVGKVAKTTGLADVTVSKALGNAADATGTRKPLVDPGYFQNYSGSEPRTFNFSFDLLPSNPKEAVDMYKLILKLKEYSSPEMATGGVSLLAPNYFELQVSSDVFSGVANIKNVVLSNISINYGADGAMQFFADGTPKYIQMTLSFKERSMVTANHYRG